jgi:hypothetical protein
MTKWLESHSYLAEWIAALPILLQLSRSTVKVAKSVLAIFGCYVLVGVILISLRFPGSQEAAKETMKTLAILMVAYFMMQSLQKVESPKMATN